MATETPDLTILDGHTVRPLTEAELAQRELDLKAAAERRAQRQALEASRESALVKLAGLGLTDTEIAALLGG
jgi:DNA-binding NarL/FixJ family response regulator